METSKRDIGIAVPIPNGKVYITLIGGIKETAYTSILYEAVDKNNNVLSAFLIDCGGNPNEDRSHEELENRFSKIPGIEKVTDIILTHPHFDHIGEAPRIANKYKMRLRTSWCGMLFVKSLCKMHGWPMPDVILFEDGDTFEVGPFVIQSFQLEHSVPEPFGFRISCFGKSINHLGDCKLTGMSKESRERSLERLRAISGSGADLQIMDMLYADQPGITPPEGPVVNNILDIVAERPKNYNFIFMISSNISRILNIWGMLWKHEKSSVRFEGRSMHNTGHIIERMLRKVNPAFSRQFPAPTNVVFGTGAQAEEFSFLRRLVEGTAEWSIQPGDQLILSSALIPNENPDFFEAKVSIMRTLLRSAIDQGARVVVHLGQADVIGIRDYGSLGSVLEAEIYVSGHERADGLKLMIEAAKAKKVLPFHWLRLTIEGLQNLIGADRLIVPPVMNQRILI